MPSKAPILDAAGKQARELELEDAVFGAEIKPHVVHETVRAEAAAARAGTRGGKTRGMVAGGRSKPWRQKGTGRARQGTTRAPQWTGGGMAFRPGTRYELKVNRKARKAALRGALTQHAQRGSLAAVDAASLGDAPSTKTAVSFLAAWGAERPLLIVVLPGEDVVAKSFRNLQKTLVVEVAQLEVTALVWARSVLLTEGALSRVQEVAR
jgi:large subunit ribosomal protein L4